MDGKDPATVVMAHFDVLLRFAKAKDEELLKQCILDVKADHDDEEVDDILDAVIKDFEL